MHTFIRCTTCLLLTVAATAGAQTMDMLSPEPGDLRPESLITAERAAAADSLNRATETIRFAQPVGADPAAAGAEGLKPYVAESRQYWTDADPADLESGVELPLSAPGALVRITPLETAGKTPLDMRQFELTLDGRPLEPRHDLELITTGGQLRAAALNVPPGSIAFRLRASAGAGLLTVRSTAGLSGRGKHPLVIHVFEQDSPVVARVSLPRQDYLAGESLHFGLDLTDGDRVFEADSIQAVVTDPSARSTWALSTTENGRTLEGELPATEAGHPAGLWEAQIYLTGTIDGMQVRRDIPVAFAVTLPTARLNGQAAPIGDDGLTIGLGVEVAQAGRYQVSGTLYGSDGTGQSVPVARAETAAWLDPGNGELGLDFADTLLEGFSGPWTLRDLRLADQGRLGLLEYRRQAVTVE